MLTLLYLGDTLTFSAWHLMGLVKDISRAETHLLAITLRRTASHNPRTFYSLIAYEIIPFSWIEEAWKGRTTLADPSISITPKAVLERDKIERKDDGTLGSVLVMSCELPPGNNQSPREALRSVRKCALT